MVPTFHEYASLPVPQGQEGFLTKCRGSTTGRGGLTPILPAMPYPDLLPFLLT